MSARARCSVRPTLLAAAALLLTRPASVPACERQNSSAGCFARVCMRDAELSSMHLVLSACKL